jgi:putative transposase
VKAVADTIGVARSNLVDQLRHPERPRRGRYRRAEDEALLAEIRAITDARPTYGYRRVTALLNRASRSSGEPPLNHKRVYRLMRQASLLLQPHTGRHAIRAHEGTVGAAASNQRWASDGFEIPCWNGEVVRFGRSLGPVALQPHPSPSTPMTARSWPGSAPPAAASASR